MVLRLVTWKFEILKWVEKYELIDLFLKFILSCGKQEDEIIKL